jgi:hypothetical protein
MQAQMVCVTSADHAGVCLINGLESEVESLVLVQAQMVRVTFDHAGVCLINGLESEVESLVLILAQMVCVTSDHAGVYFINVLELEAESLVLIQAQMVRVTSDHAWEWHLYGSGILASSGYVTGTPKRLLNICLSFNEKSRACFWRGSKKKG